MRLRDVGGKLAAFRETRGVWWCFVGGRCGWGLSFAEAFDKAVGRRPC